MVSTAKDIIICQKWRGTFSHDGGALTNQGIHHIDLIRYLGGEIKNISCKMSTLGAKIEVEDTKLLVILSLKKIMLLEVLRLPHVQGQLILKQQYRLLAQKE